jgi:hypothetical protein
MAALRSGAKVARTGPAAARTKRAAAGARAQAEQVRARPAGRKRNSIEYVRPPMYAKQRQAIFEPVDLNGNPARYSWIEASTKAGKTHGCICWLVEQALIHGAQGRNFWWVAPIYAQAKIAWERIKNSLPPSSEKFKWKAIESPLQITLPNGAVMMFKSAENPDALYGEDVYAAVIDEASRCREQSWFAVRSTLTATKGPIRAIGNVKGRANWFYKLARRAEQGNPGHAFYKMTAYDAVAGGVLAMEEIEDAKNALPEDTFKELYLAEAADDGGNPFGLQHIAKCVAPMSGIPPVALGADLAKKMDWTVLLGLDKFGATCGFERWQKRDWDSTTNSLIDLIGHLPALVDATGVGDPIVDRLKKKCRRVEGYIFSSKSKQMLMEGLAVAIQRGEVTFPDGPIRQELENFEYVYTRTGVLYSAPEGYHDDCVMALALAVEQRRLINAGAPNSLPGGSTRASPWLGAHSSDDDD